MQLAAESRNIECSFLHHKPAFQRSAIRNHLREAQLHALSPHRGLNLTADHHRNRFEWTNAHIRWYLARWRGVLCMDESQFTMFRADGGERFAYVNVVDRVTHGDGGVMVLGRHLVWTKNTGAFY